MSANEDTAATAPVKRGRGRPRKSDPKPDPKNMTMFLWTMPHRELTICMDQATDIVDVNGVHAGSMGRTILVKNGIYETADAEEIAFLKDNPDFEGEDPSKAYILANDLAKQLIAMLRKKGTTEEQLPSKMRNIMSAMSDSSELTKEKPDEPVGDSE